MSLNEENYRQKRILEGTRPNAEDRARAEFTRQVKAELKKEREEEKRARQILIKKRKLQKQREEAGLKPHADE